MKLLIIEDDRETAAYLIKGLSESGYTIDHSGDGREGLFLATSGAYDAIILDRMLPGMDGLALLGALRGAEIRTPALILSALGSVDDRVKGLRSGGDDYLVKPFAFSELLSRVRAVIRRGNRPRPAVLRCGVLVVVTGLVLVRRDVDVETVQPDVLNVFPPQPHQVGVGVERLDRDEWRNIPAAVLSDNEVGAVHTHAWECSYS